jgi:hypothetical protein
MAMQRARRLASVAVVAFLAVSGLSACRAAPGVAAYVGSAKITEDRVDRIFDDAKTRAVAPAAGQPATGLARQDIVSTLVGLDVLRSYAKEKSLTAAALPTADVAKSLSLQADAAYVPIFTEFEGLLQAISAKAAPAQLTEADVRDVYQRLVAGGALKDKQPFEQFAGSLAQQDQQVLQQRIALRNELQPAAAKLDIDVNPRYSSGITLLSASGATGNSVPLVIVQLGDADNTVPVTDAA